MNSAWDVADFDVVVAGFQPSLDGATFIYNCKVTVGSIHYTLEKRFSEFHSLHNALFTAGYGGLPNPPSKTLTRPNDPATAEQREEKLNAYIRSLCVRPDVRQSDPMIRFLRLDTELGGQAAPRPLEISTIANTTDAGPYSVVDCCHTPSDHHPQLFVSAMVDTTALSKLGRAWSVIEPEYVGALNIYKVTEINGVMQMLPVFVRQAQKKINVCRFIKGVNRAAQLLLVGDSEGLYSVYEVRMTSATTAELSVLSTYEMHIKATIVQLVESRHTVNLFASIGMDNGIRLFSMDTSNYQLNLLSSGRVAKPLHHPKEMLTSVALLDGSIIFRDRVSNNSLVNTCKRVLVGTNCGQVLIYDVSGSLPSYRGAINLNLVLKFFESGCVGIPLPDLASLGGSDTPSGKAAMDSLYVLGNTVTQIRVVRDESDADVLVVAIKGLILVLDMCLVAAADPAREIGAFEEKLTYTVPYDQTNIASRSSTSAYSQILTPTLLTPALNKLSEHLPLVPPANSPRRTVCSEGITSYIKHIFECPMDHYNKVTVTAMYVDDAQGLLYCSYQRGICVWNLRDRNNPEPLLHCMEYFRWGTIRRLQMMPVSHQGVTANVLFAATSLGGLRMLNVEDVRHWQLWLPGRDSAATRHLLYTSLHSTDSEPSRPPTAKDIAKHIDPASEELQMDPIEEIYQAFRPLNFNAMESQIFQTSAPVLSKRVQI